jgi:Rrf2 family protein
MVVISRKVDYAILALCHLMKTPSGASAREVAACYRLSRPFLANILKELCHQGFVESHRGINGGYRLAKAPSAITIEEVITALDGPFELMSCARSDNPDLCGVGEICPVKAPLRGIHEQIAAILAETTLEDLGNSENSLVTISTENAEHGDCAHLLG